MRPKSHILSIYTTPKNGTARLKTGLKKANMLTTGSLDDSETGKLLGGLRLFKVKGILVLDRRPKGLISCFPRCFSGVLVSTPYSKRNVFHGRGGVIGT